MPGNPTLNIDSRAFRVKFIWRVSSCLCFVHFKTCKYCLRYHCDNNSSFDIRELPSVCGIHMIILALLVRMLVLRQCSKCVV